MKEWFRKKIVSLKRNPNYIPLIMIIVSCLAYNLKLTSYSDAIAVINSKGMGVCLFITSLSSFLSIITFLTAFPRREKPKIASIVLVVFFLVASIVCEAILRYMIMYGVTYRENPVPVNAAILSAYNMTMVHIILLSISILLIVTMPLYHKLLLKINTSLKTDEIKIEKVDTEDDKE